MGFWGFGDGLCAQKVRRLFSDARSLEPAPARSRLGVERAESKFKMGLADAFDRGLRFADPLQQGGQQRPGSALGIPFQPVPDEVAGRPAAPELAACRFVVVLGSGHAEMPEWSMRLPLPVRKRIVERSRILRLLPEATLIVSGPADDHGVTHASVLAATAVSLGARTPAFAESRERPRHGRREPLRRGDGRKRAGGARDFGGALAAVAGLFRHAGIRI